MNLEELDKAQAVTIDNIESLFVKHYFKKEFKDLTKDDRHEMDCFGMFGMTDWVYDNVTECTECKK